MTSGKIILIILGKGQRFPAITIYFLTSLVSLRTVMVLVGVLFSMLMYYNEYMIRLDVF